MNAKPASIHELMDRIKEKSNYLEKKSIFPDPCPCEYSNFQRLKHNIPVKCEYFKFCGSTGTVCPRLNHWVETGVFRSQLATLVGE